MAFTTRPTLSGDFAMVSTTHWLATAAGMSVLERGGNAADAACAAAFALHVVEPHLNGPGGDAPILWTASDGEPQVLGGQGPAPSHASAQAYRAMGLDLVPGSGPLAAAVPGAVDAWLVLLRDKGTWGLEGVLEHAIALAERGHFPIAQIGRTVESVRSLFTDHWTTSADVYLRDGRSPSPDERLTNPALAATWKRWLAESEAGGGDRETRIERARQVWRQGFIAEALVRAANTPTLDATGTEHAASWEPDEQLRWEPTWEPTVSHSWGDWTVHKADQWTQGPVFLQQLALLDDLTPADLTTTDSGDFDAATVHRLVEGAKLAFADRDAWYGDARPTPLDLLLDGGYTAVRRSLIREVASLGWVPGEPFEGIPAHVASHITGLLRGDRVAAAASGLGEPTVQHQQPTDPYVTRRGETLGDTCHIDVVDRWGTMVAATPSGGWLQSNPVIPELGFPLGSRLQMAWLDEDLPNTLTPGKRPRTTLTPSIAQYEGRPTLAFGTPGGDQQDQWSFHLFCRIAHDFETSLRGGRARLDLQTALDAPNWHTEHVVGSFYPRGWIPNTIAVEGNTDPAVVGGLHRRGHIVQVGPAWSEGRLCVVARHPHTGQLLAGANPRGMQGYAAGR
ncbi:gamma-glutamyltransferase family protein [Aestuariimicrobium kwangyangense]|uniref:gamma-glutamyltransferase family protein n=1 Tax=Aestuariimicrobium kwangyangense TaxID=396389 RepID=UPI0003B4665F|nr:gamma-glutamyltransferase [Aestuariimicrobium kwangyangense]